MQGPLMQARQDTFEEARSAVGSGIRPAATARATELSWPGDDKRANMRSFEAYGEGARSKHPHLFRETACGGFLRPWSKIKKVSRMELCCRAVAVPENFSAPLPDTKQPEATKR